MNNSNAGGAQESIDATGGAITINNERANMQAITDMDIQAENEYGQ